MIANPFPDLVVLIGLTKSIRIMREGTRVIFLTSSVETEAYTEFIRYPMGYY